MGAMLNAYPDSVGGDLGGCVSFLKKPKLKDVFTDFYLLPSIFDTDLDRGFSVVSYDLNETLVSPDDLSELKNLGIGLKLDFVLNHASVLSKQFRDILEKGEDSEYADFFVDWNKFWEGCGPMDDEGFIRPDPEYLKDMYFRKPGLPLLMVPLPNGGEKPYWNTFYQETIYPNFDTQDFIFEADVQYGAAEKLAVRVNDALSSGKRPEEIDFEPLGAFKTKFIQLIKSRRRFLGQMDMNIKSPLVWEFYDNTLRKLAGYGAAIVRLDAFAYAAKEPGARNFMNDPGTWDLLKKVRKLATEYKLSLLPEIHTEYREKVHEKLADEGYLIYDFFLPGLLIHALEKHTSEYILRWINDIQEKNLRTVNMLGCHDGIPLLDLRGLLPDEEIEATIEIIVGRGGDVKDILGSKNMYYQVNATYYSALGERDDKMLLARALQLFMPGKPQIWYLDLFGGKNDHDAVKIAGVGGHKEINRSNLSMAQVEAALDRDLVIKQLELLRFRNSCPAFGEGAKLKAGGDGSFIYIEWVKDGVVARLDADLRDYAYEINVK